MYCRRRFWRDGGAGALVGVHRIQKLESLHPVLLQLTKHYLQAVKRGTPGTWNFLVVVPDK